MSLIQRKSDAHWYTRDGEPMHTVNTCEGGHGTEKLN